MQIQTCFLIGKRSFISKKGKPFCILFCTSSMPETATASGDIAFQVFGQKDFSEYIIGDQLQYVVVNGQYNLIE